VEKFSLDESMDTTSFAADAWAKAAKMRRESFIVFCLQARGLKVGEK
jgi:hypothetical protein